MSSVEQPPTAGPSAPSTAPAPDPAAEARAEARAARIAAAVERGKTEYQSQHAHTERGWFLDADLAGPSKKDRQAVEYASTLRVLANDPEEAARAVADIRACAGPKLASLARDLLTTGVRAAVIAKDKEAAVEFARASKKHWAANPGLAVECSNAFAFAGEGTESTHPLLASFGQGVHYPVLAALDERLGAASATEEAVRALAEVVHALAMSRAWAFSRPLYSTDKSTRSSGILHGSSALRDTLFSIDRTALRQALGVDPSTLNGALARLGRALGGSEENEPAPGERVERGVREL